MNITNRKTDVPVGSLSQLNYDMLTCSEKGMQFLTFLRASAFPLWFSDHPLLNLIDNKLAPNIINVNRALQHNSGDGLRITGYQHLIEDGVEGCNLVEGTEECPPNDEMFMKINLISKGACVTTCAQLNAQQGGVLSEDLQRTTQSLANWFKYNSLVPSVAHHLCGYTSPLFLTDPGWSDEVGSISGQHSGFNPITPPSTILTPVTKTDGNGNRTFGGFAEVKDESALTEENKFNVLTLSFINTAIRRAGRQRLEPIRGNEGGVHFDYVLLLHPDQADQLRSDPDFTNIVKSVDDRGGKNRIVTGAIGVFGSVLIKVEESMTTGIDAKTNKPLPNVRRAVLLGKNAGTLAVGGFHLGSVQPYCDNIQLKSLSNEQGKVPYLLIRECKDYGAIINLVFRAIYGFTKNTLNGKDLGVSVISTYSPALNPVGAKSFVDADNLKQKGKQNGK